MSRASGWWTLITAPLCVVGLIAGAWLAVPGDYGEDGYKPQSIEIPVKADGKREYQDPTTRCNDYKRCLKNTQSCDATRESMLKEECSKDCSSVVNYSARVADNYWKNRADERFAWSFGWLIGGLVATVTALLLVQWKRIVANSWNPGFVALFAFTISALAAFVGVAVHEGWTQAGPRQLRQAAMPIISLKWDPQLWGSDGNPGACHDLLTVGKADFEGNAAKAWKDYRGLGHSFTPPAHENEKQGKELTKDEIKLRSDDVMAVMKTVLEETARKGEDVDKARPPATEPGVYDLVREMTYGADARNTSLSGLFYYPVESVGKWRVVLFVQMAVSALVTAVAAFILTFVIRRFV